MVFNVPGSDDKKLQKALGLDLDVMVLDFEDGVALNQKPKARQLVAEMLSKADFGRTERTVRINSIKSGENLINMDLAALKPVLNKVDSILIPKVEKAADCDYVTSFLESQGNKTTRIFACVETARGILSLEEICSRSNRLDAIVFGSEDYSADVGITRTAGLEELLFARSAVVTSCAAYGVQSIDLVCIDFKNNDQLIKECQSGYSLGFDGKQAIHPAQIQTIYQHFCPPQKTLEFAKKIVDEYQAHLERGIGAFVIDEKVIDMPMIKWAEKVLRKANLL